MIQNLITIILTLGLSVGSTGAKDLPSESVFHLKGPWINPEGQQIALSHLAGQTLVLAMVYTTCQYSCPLIIEEMNRIRKKVPSHVNEKVRYVLISIDPSRDTPDVMKKFAAKRRLDLSRWALLTAKDEGPVRELSTVLGANYKKMGSDFAHSNLITIIDGEGVVLFSKANIGQQIQEAADAIIRSTSKSAVK